MSNACSNGGSHTSRRGALSKGLLPRRQNNAQYSIGFEIVRSFAFGLLQPCYMLYYPTLGIDAAAHEGALQVGAPTVGVLGSGHERFFPSHNRGLAERMVAGGGAVLSPYPPENGAHPGQFLARNGIVAALADAVLVIEAPARSGPASIL